MAKEGRPKFNPRPGRGLNPGPPGWQPEILPAVPTSHTQENTFGIAPVIHAKYRCLVLSIQPPRHLVPVVHVSVQDAEVHHLEKLQMVDHRTDHPNHCHCCCPYLPLLHAG